MASQSSPKPLLLYHIPLILLYSLLLSTGNSYSMYMCSCIPQNMVKYLAILTLDNYSYLLITGFMVGYHVDDQPKHITSYT